MAQPDVYFKGVSYANFKTDSTPAGPAGGSLAGNYPNPSLAATGVTPAIYGTTSQVAQFTVSADGRVTNASNVPISGTVPGGAAGGALTGTYPNPTIGPSGVAAGTYGSSADSAQLVIGNDGRVTSAANVAISVPPSGAAGGSLTGTYPNPTLALTGVVAATYGSYHQVARVIAAADGRLTSAQNVEIGDNGVFGSTVLGTNATAASQRGTAFGNLAVAGQDAAAFGYDAQANNNYSTGVGGQVRANGDFSTAYGNSCAANGTHSCAYGTAAIASGGFSVAVGSHGAGNSTTANATGATAVGSLLCTASGVNSSAFGAGSLASVANGLALGANAAATTTSNGIGFGVPSASVVSGPSNSATLGTNVNLANYTIPLRPNNFAGFPFAVATKVAAAATGTTTLLSTDAPYQIYTSSYAGAGATFVLPNTTTCCVGAWFFIQIVRSGNSATFALNQNNGTGLVTLAGQSAIQRVEAFAQCTGVTNAGIEWSGRVVFYQNAGTPTCTYFGP